MAGADFTSWRLTDQERRWGYSAAIQSSAAFFLGPVGPLAVWALEYLFDRRDLIFSEFGAPAQAFDVTGQALSLPTLGTRPAARQGTLSLHTGLTGSARELGLRNGDPVGLVLTGHAYVQARSRLVVPARVGERVDVAVPQGTYSLAAFASRRDSLFTKPDPFSAAIGSAVALGGRNELELSLTARKPVQRAQPRLWGPPPDSTVSGAASVVQVGQGPPQTWHKCVRCGRVAFGGGVPHICPLAALPALRCYRCTATFSTQTDLDTHMRDPHARTCWYCGYSESVCDCLFGVFKRFWEGY